MKLKVILVGNLNLEERANAYREIDFIPIDLAILPDNNSEHPSFISLKKTSSLPSDRREILLDIFGQLPEQRESIKEAMRQKIPIILHPSSWEEFDEIKEVITNKHYPFYVSDTNRFDHKIETLKAELNSGQLGHIGCLKLIRLLPYDHPGINNNILYSHFDLLDSILYLGGDVVRVYAKGTKLRHSFYDNLYIITRFKSGAIGYIEMSCAYPLKYHLEHYDIACQSGLLEYSSHNEAILHANDFETSHEVALARSPLSKMIEDKIYKILRKDNGEGNRNSFLKSIQFFKGCQQSLEKGEVVQL